jgi:hypothetical protein
MFQPQSKGEALIAKDFTSRPFSQARLPKKFKKRKKKKEQVSISRIC